jgi:hypothetical protein
MKKQLHYLLLFCTVFYFYQFPKAFANGSAADFSGCCKAPADLVYWCNDLPYDFNPHYPYQLQKLFGKPQNKCYPNVWVELEPTINLSNCETGTIIRHFKVQAHYGYEYCDQTIIIKGTHDYEIRFPADLTVPCGQIPAKEELQTTESGCDLLAINVMDQNFGTPGTACSKIFRTYRVINWCEYDGISDRVVISRDEDCDGAPGDEDVWILRRSNGTAYIDRDNQEYNGNPRAYERLVCYPSNPKGYWRTVRSTGYWEYTQHIKVMDKAAPTIVVEQPNPVCSYNNNCDAFVTIPFTVNDDCTPDNIKIKVFIDGIKIAEYSKGGTYKANGTYKVGFHYLEIHASDGCGNSAVLKIPFQVVDCKAPAPICINGITVSLMPVIPAADMDGDSLPDKAAMTIWASDLVASQVSDCSGFAGYSINRVGEKPHINQTSLVLTCNDLGTLYVEIYAWDNAHNPYRLQPNGTLGGRNYGFCRTYILVQDNRDVCGVYGSLAGSVRTPDSTGLNAVPMLLVSNDSSHCKTDTLGRYGFDSLAIGKNYKIIPQEIVHDGLNHITREDLLLLQRHLSGEAPLTSPYQLIAADVDRSGSVTDADLTALERWLQTAPDSLTPHFGWRFVDAAYRFPNPKNPWQERFPESISITRLPKEPRVHHFIAVQVGDLNGVAIANASATQHRNTTNTATSYSTDTLFLNQLRDQKTAQLREAFNLKGQTEEFTQASLNSDPPAAGFILPSTESRTEAAFALYPNVPNPFRDETTIAFQLPEATTATISVYDLTGKLLWQHRRPFDKGYHQLTLNRQTLPAEGVLLYTLQTPTHRAGGKMVVLTR